MLFTHICTYMYNVHNPGIGDICLGLFDVCSASKFANPRRGWLRGEGGAVYVCPKKQDDWMISMTMGMEISLNYTFH